MRIAFASMTALWFVFASVAPAAPLSFSYTYGLGPESQPAAEYPDGAYPDIPTDNTELNDDTIGTTTFSGSSSTDPWVGFIDQASNGQPQPQIDIAFTDPLGHSLTSITVTYLAYQSPYLINEPDSLTLTFSDDNVFDMNDPTQTFTAFPSTSPNVHAATFGLGGQTAKHVRAVFLNDGPPETYWTFLTEIDFDGGPVPEPASAAVLALGGGAMLLTRRRAPRKSGGVR